MQWNPYLDGIQSPLVISKLQPSLEESWPIILQAVALDAIPVSLDGIENSSINNVSENNFLSGYSMVELDSNEYRFLWSFALFSLFRGHHSLVEQKIQSPSTTASVVEDSPKETPNPIELKLYEIVLPVFQSLSAVKFCSAGFLTVDICIELLQVHSVLVPFIPLICFMIQNCSR